MPVLSRVPKPPTTRIRPSARGVPAPHSTSAGGLLCTVEPVTGSYTEPTLGFRLPNSRTSPVCSRIEWTPMTRDVEPAGWNGADHTPVADGTAAAVPLPVIRPATAMVTAATAVNADRRRGRMTDAMVDLPGSVTHGDPREPASVEWWTSWGPSLTETRGNRHLWSGGGTLDPDRT